MTEDDIIKMGKECGFAFDSLGGTYTTGSLSRNLKDFANLVAAAERKKTEPATVPHTVSREEFLQKYYLGSQRTINYLKIENQQLISSEKVWKDRCLKLGAALVTKDVSLPEQEPYGYFKPEAFGWIDCAETDEGAIPLYEKPLLMFQPLTDEEIDDLWAGVSDPSRDEIDMNEFARAIEAAHGIKQ